MGSGAEEAPGEHDEQAQGEGRSGRESDDQYVGRGEAAGVALKRGQRAAQGAHSASSVDRRPPKTLATSPGVSMAALERGPPTTSPVAIFVS